MEKKKKNWLQFRTLCSALYQVVIFNIMSVVCCIDSSEPYKELPNKYVYLFNEKLIE